MPTILETLTEPGVARYKRSIFAVGDGKSPDAIPDRATLEAAGRLANDWTADLKTYRDRLQKVADLKTADEIEAEANAIEIPTPVDHGAVMLADITTVADLYKALEDHKHGALSAPSEKIEYNRLRGEARAIRSSAMQTLATTADPEISKNLAEINQQIGALQGAIHDREAVLAQAAAVEDLRTRLDDLGRGVCRDDDPDDWPIAAVISKHRRELEGYPAGIVADGRRAESDDRKAHAKIASLQIKGSKLAKTRLVPQNMRWS